MMHVVRGLGALLVIAATAATLRATSVAEPSFPDLVSRAQLVFIGETVGVESRWVTTSSGPAIITRVTYRVVRTLKGNLGVQTTLEFLGGTVGEARLVVAGMPTFRVGDKDVLFADERGRSVSPIVGFMHGRFRVLHDPASGRESVTRHNFKPLARVDELGATAPPAQVPASRTLSLLAFEAEIARAVRRPLPAQR